MKKTAIYKASAGSGKTYTLAREYIRLLLSQTNADAYKHILAVTFTKKATAEMKDRILQELSTLATRPADSDYIREEPSLKSELCLTEGEIKKRANAALSTMLRNYTSFQVQTIDGFFQQVLRQFAHELSLPQLYNLSMDADLIIEEGVDQMLYDIRTQAEKSKELFGWMRELVENNISEGKGWDPRAQIVDLASGLMTEEYQQKVDKNASGYSDENLKNYIERLKSICSKYEQDVLDAQAKGLQIIAANGLSIGDFKSNTMNPFLLPISKLHEKEPDFVCKKTMANIFSSNDEYPCKKKDPNQAAIQAAMDGGLRSIGRTLIDLMGTQEPLVCPKRKRDYNTARAILKNIRILAILMHLERIIMEANREQNRLPIGQVNGLINRVIDNADAPFIYEKIGTRLQHYMLDEFQDTSVLQWRNFKPLIHDNISQGNSNLIVGDVKQSIYRWRNSSWQLLQSLPEDSDLREGIEEKPMTHNFRSAAAIVESNNEVLRVYANALHESLGSNSPIEAAYSSLEQEVGKKSMHGYYQIRFAAKNSAAPDETLQQIKETIEDVRSRGVAMNEIAILLRTKDDIARIAEYLTGEGIAIQTGEGLRIASHPAISMLTSAMQWILTPNDPLISAQMAYHYYQEAMHMSEMQALQHMFTNPQPIQEEVMQEIRAAAAYNLYELVQRLIDLLELHTWKDATSYLLAFQDMVYTYAGKSSGDLAGFMDYWELKRSKACIPASAQKEAVQIMTIHTSKGLEFDVVIVPKLNWDIDFQTNSSHITRIWQQPTGDCQADIYVPVDLTSKLQNTIFEDVYEQERANLTIDNLNLLYVALTRPKHELYVFAQAYDVDANGQFIKGKSFNTGKNLHHVMEEAGLLEDNQYIRGKKELFKQEEETSTNLQAPLYVSTHNTSGLHLRSRSMGDEFELSQQEIGNLMHEWLAHVRTADDRDQALHEMKEEGQINESLFSLMQSEWHSFWTLIEKEGHTDWFAADTEVVNEWTIMTKDGDVKRPDRVVLRDKHAIVIDYKFGKRNDTEHLYVKQVTEYKQLLEEMGYTTEGYIVYVEKQKIKQV